MDPELVGLRDTLGNFDKELVDEEYEKLITEFKDMRSNENL